MAPKGSQSPIPNPYAIDYAPTDRATCKPGQACDGRIALDSLRFLRKVWSRFHDGFDEQKYHLRCGKKFTENLGEIRLWQALRWSDILKVAKSFDAKIDEGHPAVQAVKRRSDAIWSLKSMLMEIPKKQLLPILDANGIPYNEKKISYGGEIRCNGYVSASTKCVFSFILSDILRPNEAFDNSATGVSVDDLKRTEIFVLPDEAKRIPVFKKWKCPQGVEGCMELGNPLGEPRRYLPAIKGCRQLAQRRLCKTALNLPLLSACGCWVCRRRAFPQAVGLNKALEGLETPHSTAEKESSEPEAIPVGKELVGLSFTSVGATDPPKVELQLLIEKHAGEYTRVLFCGLLCSASEQLEGRTTFLLVGDGDSHEFTKKYRDAKAAGVPIVHSDFISALLKRENSEPKSKLAMCRKWKGSSDGPDPRPTGLLLRKKKYAQYYLVEGKLTHELPDAAESLKQLSEAQAKEKPQTQRPPIAKKSPLLEVDPLFSNKRGRIYVDSYGNAFNCTTQYTDISTGINKYYSMQIVQTNKTFHFFTKWGRLGADDKLTNDYKQQSFGQDVGAAVEAFEAKFLGLTGTHWNDRFSFVQQPGRYGFVELAGYQMGDETQKNAKEPPLKRPKLEAASASSTVDECTLPPAVKAIVELIFDRKLTEKLLSEQHLNLKKLPIDSISKRQLQEGYAVLQEIQNLLREDPAQTNTLKHQTRLADATNRFYIKIPHVFAVSEKPPVLDSFAKLRAKIEMMEQLLEVSVAQSLLTDALLNAKDKHPLDAQYEQLRCKLEPVSESDEERKLVERLISNTHAPTHNTWKLKVKSVFKCDRQGEAQRFNKEMDNRMLLWHGSRLTNWPSILAKGLQIAPPEAPSSGYMFDKGIYFADMVSKSSQYCYASSAQPHGLLVLCEVALGKQRRFLQADYEAAKKCKKDGQDSAQGIGRMCPNPKSDFEIPSVVDEKPVRVCGGKSWNNSKTIDQLREEIPGKPEAALMYNEYIVYDPRQVKIRYLVHVEFEFESFDLDSP
ncbi:NAD(+) ADP-ribosyltransferase, putative [Eimeria necatrix]|uniref:Poly [ADP-ribose] polymerase n=1 Tax=Eimeria necatrix TaxID=51315 RepID=U6MMJ9_9EIME|nr:NAD(+) ADP-ribosyltransferase, putative [Eimeria necatrix]CDJ64298.1 NAD(+) ADP-ribosyltransferase, putative [Eimeria necatrix]